MKYLKSCLPKINLLDTTTLAAIRTPPHNKICSTGALLMKLCINIVQPFALLYHG